MDCLNLKCLKGTQIPTPSRSRPPRPPRRALAPVPLPVPELHKQHRLSNMSTNNDNQNDGSSHLDSSAENKIKFLCSFGGKIVPKPSDGQLVYVGGDTRVISIPRSITFLELTRKIEEMYKTARMVIKYSIMPEDLDTLISVMSDDDLANMWDERDILVSSDSKSKFLRLFIFQKSRKSTRRISCQNYLDAINY